MTVGAAPDAQWIADNAINQGVGSGFDQDILDAFQWLTDPDGNANTMDDVPDVIQNSWGVTTGHVGYASCFNNWNTVITNCEAAGPVVTWSAGNEGPTAQSLRSPAKYQLTPTQIFSVGAWTCPAIRLHRIRLPTFSSRGPSGCDPDVERDQAGNLRAGRERVSPAFRRPLHRHDERHVDGRTARGGHRGPDARSLPRLRSADDQGSAAVNTAVTAVRPAGDDNTFGMGFINAYEAVSAVFSLGRIDGYVTASGGQPIANVTVHADGTSNSVLTNAQGYYNLPLRRRERIRCISRGSPTCPSPSQYGGDGGRHDPSEH